MSDLGRRPPRDVIRALRQEVGFCCPVRGCGNPYLTWHHFDPPWAVEHHHRPVGMIALCRQHADQADHGAFTEDQLRELKRLGRERASEVRGRFNWMRQDLLAVVGGNFYYQLMTILEINDTKCIWLDRDEDGYLQLNFQMPTVTGRPRAQIEGNFWRVLPAVNEVVCPPSGRLVEVSYNNGDKFRAEFFGIESADALDARYRVANTRQWSSNLQFPITAVEIWETAAGTSIEFGPSSSNVRGIQFKSSYMQGNARSAIHLTMGKEELELLMPREDKTYEKTEVYLTDLLDKARRPPILEGYTFSQCKIHGPIITYFGGPNVFDRCTFQDPVEAIFREVPEGSPVTGVVQLIACRFTECEIEGMGVIGSPDQIAALRQGLEPPAPPPSS